MPSARRRLSVSAVPTADRRLSAPCEHEVDGRPLPPDLKVARLAGDEWGVLSLDELRECGLSIGCIRTRVKRGWLHRLHRAVYAVGHDALTLEGRLLAAVKAFGGDAVLSHYSAAALWEFLAWDGRRPEVTVVRAGTRVQPGIRVHRTALLEPRDTVHHRGISVTAPARTLIDLAAVVSYPLLRRAVRQAQSLRRVSVHGLVAAIRRLGPRRGVVNLNRILATGPASTRSELEDILLDLILESGLARPDVNVPLLLDDRRLVPDFRWPDRRVIVEADGAAWHESKTAREDDAERQALLEASGERVLRVTWAQAIGAPAQTIERLREAGVPLSVDRRLSACRAR